MSAAFICPPLRGSRLTRASYWDSVTLHATRRTPHGTSRFLRAMSAWLVKTRRAPSRHCRNARVYRHTPTAMHEMSSPPPPPPAWLVNTRRAPSRHSRDARVYGHTTTAMHKVSTPLAPPRGINNVLAHRYLPPSPLSSPPLRCPPPLPSVNVFGAARQLIVCPRRSTYRSSDTA